MLSHSTNELDLWCALRQGDEAALAELIRRYARPLLHYGRKIVPSDALIEDCIQEVFIQLWTYRERLREEVGEVKAYLFASLRRRLVNERKSPGYYIGDIAEQGLDTPFDITFTVEERLIETEREAYWVALLARHMNELPKRHKEALHLKFYGGLDNQQIAEVMGVRYQTATNLIHEALVRLRNALPKEALTTFGLLVAHWLS